MKKLLKVCISSPYYWLPKILLIVLCLLHEKTKYHTARSIGELFYWPEGPCLDMVVLGAFGIAMVLSIWGDWKVLKQR